MTIQLTDDEYADIRAALAVLEALQGFVRRTDQQAGAKEAIKRGHVALENAYRRARVVAPKTVTRNEGI